MLAEAGNWKWLILFIYIIPVVIGYKAVKRLISNIESKYPGDRVKEETRRSGAGRFYGLVFIIPIVIFIVFIAFRIFAPEGIYSQNFQSRIFHGYWIYVMSAGIPLTLVGIVYGLRGLCQNRKGPWPVLCVIAGFAALFVMSIFTVLLLLD